MISIIIVKDLVQIETHYHHRAMWIRRVFVSVDHFSRIGLEKNLAAGCTTCIDIDNRANAITPNDLALFAMNEGELCIYVRVFDIVHSNKCVGCILQTFFCTIEYYKWYMSIITCFSTTPPRSYKRQ